MANYFTWLMRMSTYSKNGFSFEKPFRVKFYKI